MSREEVAAFLRNVQLSLDQLQRTLDNGVSGLPGVPRDSLASYLHEQKVALTRAYGELLEDWRRFEDETGLIQAEQVGSPLAARSSEAEAAAADAGATPLTMQLRSLDKRVAQMGGIPALGACVLPKSTPGARSALNATASPAAIEILRGRMSGSDAEATPLRKTQTEEAGPACTPLVTLRKVEIGPAKGAAAATPGLANRASELAAALQKRAALRAAQEAATTTP